VNYAYSQPI
jgi:rRNA biogenesis protein RRP5